MTTPASEPVPAGEPEAPASLINLIAPYLVLIAEILRPAWDCDVLADAILAAGMAGWSPARLLREFARLAGDEDTSPWDLRRLAASPLRRDPEAASGRPRNAEYLAARAAVDAIPPLPEHRGRAGAA